MNKLKLEKVIKDILDAETNPLFTTQLSKKITNAVIILLDEK